MVIKKKHEDMMRDKFISQGGDSVKDIKSHTTLCVRISGQLIEDMHVVIKDREGLSRNAWILEAIQDKIKKERKNG